MMLSKKGWSIVLDLSLTKARIAAFPEWILFPKSSGKSRDFLF